jgi:transposase
MNDALRAEIVARFRGGASLRRIARELHVSYHSVRRALREIEQARSGGPPPQPAPRGSQLEAFEPTIRDLLARYPDITAQRVLEELRGYGYTGGYTVLSERVRQLRRTRRHPRTHLGQDQGPSLLQQRCPPLLRPDACRGGARLQHPVQLL